MPYIREIVNYIPFFYLQIVPPCLALALLLFSLAFRDKRGVITLLALVESLTCAFTCFHDEGGVAVAIGYGFLLFSGILFFSPVLRLRTKGEKRERKTVIKEAQEEVKIIPSAPVPKAIIQQENTPMPLNKGVNADVQLTHVFQVLKKLQSAKLSAGDRLETDVIQNMLTVYQAKETLSVEETHSLNNYLATLLKLMSKYSL